MFLAIYREHLIASAQFKFSKTFATMWKFLFGAAILIALAEAQRSSYAPRPGSNSRLLARFRKNQTAAVTENDLNARGGEEEFDSDSVPSSSLSPELRGTLEDEKFVDRVSRWPQDRQPFWYKNRHAISSARNRWIDGGDANEAPPASNQRPAPRSRTDYLSHFQQDPLFGYFNGY